MVSRRYCRKLGVESAGPVEAALLQINLLQFVAGLYRARLARQDLLKTRDGPLKHPFLVIHNTEIEPGLDVVRADLQGLVQRRLGLLEAAVLFQRAAQIAPGIGVVRPNLDRAPQAGDRLLQIAALLQRLAKVVVGQGMVGHGREHPAIARGGGFEAAHVAQYVAQVADHLQAVRRLLHGTTDQRSGKLHAADLLGRHAQGVVRLGILGTCGKSAAKPAKGLDEARFAAA